MTNNKKGVYVIYDDASKSFLHSYLANNDNEAKRTFTAYAVGSNDLFCDTLLLVRACTIDGTKDTNFVAASDSYTVCKYQDVETLVKHHRANNVSHS